MKYLREIDIPLRDRTLPGILERGASRNGEKSYIVFGDNEVSYSETRIRSARLAAGLASAGVQAQDHVAIIMSNRPEFLISYFAIGIAGAVSLPINTASKGDQLAHFLGAFDAKFLIVEAALLDRVDAVLHRCPLLECIVVVDADAPFPQRVGIRTFDFNSLLSAQIGASGSAAFSDTALINFTSGTTGPSKGSISTHCSITSAAMSYAQAFGYQADDRLYTCLPLFHSNAFISSCLAALVSDATVVIASRFSASTFWADVRRQRATQFNLLGAMANILWARPPSDDEADNEVRLCFMVPVPDFARQFEGRFQLKISSCYAVSDYGTATLLPPDHPAEKWKSAGTVRNGYEIQIVDPDDMPVANGQVGEIVIRALEPWTSAQGYYKLPEATLQCQRNMWFHSGDRGYLDAEGYLYFVDRTKETIRRKGENISSFEVEQVVLSYDGVAEVAAFPVSNSMADEEVMVSVVPRPGASVAPDALVRFCADRMAHFMVPRFVEIVSKLPKTATEKVEKQVLRAEAERRLSEIWDREREGVPINR